MSAPVLLGVIILAGIAPVKPSEFRIIRIQQKTLDSADS